MPLAPPCPPAQVGLPGRSAPREKGPPPTHRCAPGLGRPAQGPGRRQWRAEAGAARSGGGQGHRGHRRPGPGPRPCRERKGEGRGCLGPGCLPHCPAGTRHVRGSRRAVLPAAQPRLLGEVVVALRLLPQVVILHALTHRPCAHLRAVPVSLAPSPFPACSPPPRALSSAPHLVAPAPCPASAPGPPSASLVPDAPRTAAPTCALFLTGPAEGVGQPRPREYAERAHFSLSVGVTGAPGRAICTRARRVREPT